MADWKAGDPCDSCGSRLTYVHFEFGPCCDGCGRTDADE